MCRSLQRVGYIFPPCLPSSSDVLSPGFHSEKAEFALDGVMADPIVEGQVVGAL